MPIKTIKNVTESEIVNNINYKNYNNQFFKTFLILISAIICLNYFINPYNIFDNSYLPFAFLKPEATIQERYTKFIALKLNRKKLDTVFLGTSRVDYALQKKHYTAITGKSAENLGVGGLFINEYTDILDEILLIHPEIKNVYLGLDFATFSKNREDNNQKTRYKISKTPYITPNELGFSILSLKSTGDSIWTVIKNLLGLESRMFYTDGTKHVYYNKDIEKSFNKSFKEYKKYYQYYELNPQAFNTIQKLVKSCQNRNINIVVFIMPTHITDQYLIYKTERWEDFAQWKKTLTQIAPIYDFQYPHAYNCEDITPDMTYFFESSHSTHILGDKIIDSLLGKNRSYGRILTKNNVNFLLEKDKSNLLEYMNKNKGLKQWADEKIQ